MSPRLPAFVLLACGLIALSACKKSPPPNVAATVNGRSITYADLDKQYAAAQLPQPRAGTGGAAEGEDSVAVTRLEVLRTLIDNEIMLQRAEKLGLMAQEADVDAKVNELKAPYTQEEFQKRLADAQDHGRGTQDPDPARLERAETVQQGDYFAHQHHRQGRGGRLQRQSGQLQPGGAPVAHRAILVTPNPDPNVRNLKARQGAE